MLGLGELLGQVQVVLGLRLGPGICKWTVVTSITSSGGSGARPTDHYRFLQVINDNRLRLLKRHRSSGGPSLQMPMFVSCAAGAGEVYAARVRLMEDDD